MISLAVPIPHDLAKHSYCETTESYFLKQPRSLFVFLREMGEYVEHY